VQAKRDTESSIISKFWMPAGVYPEKLEGPA